MNKPTTHTQTGTTPRRASTDQLIAAADLPTPVAERIASIVRATRLWKSERADIARELIAHAHDALAAGRSPEDTADSLGDPTTIARLLRRSARRKRPWHWQARHRTLQAIGISLLAMIGVYTILFIRFNTGSPSITHNYLAELNERNNAFSEDQKALPAFEALHRLWSPLYFELLRADAEAKQAKHGSERHPTNAFDQLPFSSSDAPLYDQLMAAHASVLPQIDAAIAASRLPTLGVIYSDRYEKITTDAGVGEFRMLAPSEDPALAEPVFSVLLPWLGHARGLGKLILFDAMVAARAGDSHRTTESLTAVFDLARLVGQEHTLIASLVAIALQTDAEQMLLQILHNDPDLLHETHLAAIAHTAAVSGRTARDLDFETERRMFGDFLQRAYTDDGQGDGRLTAKGVQMFRNIGIPKVSDALDPLMISNESASSVTGPLAMLTYGSRQDQRRMHDLLIDIAQASLQESPYAPKQLELRDQMIKAVGETQQNPRYWMVLLVVPAFHPSIETAHKSEAHTNATLTTIALHIHHQRTGRWPDTLAELTPHLLPTIPEDPFDPGQPIKYHVIDGVPHIYFVGAHGQDNHAARPTEATERDVSSLERRYMQGRTSPSPLPADRGDWVIFPPEPHSSRTN